MEVRLNLGAGDNPELQIPGYVALDVKSGHKVYPLPANIIVGTERVELRDGSVDALYCSHVLEHFSHSETESVLREWVRVLKPGGVIRLAVPNFDWIKAHADDPMAEQFLLGGHTDENDSHGAIFTDAKLRKMMTAAGLVDIKPWVSELKDCASLPVSLNLQGVKADPDAQPKDRLKIPPILAVLSRARYGPLGIHSNIFRVLNGLNIQLAESEGVFWGQCLTRLIEEAISKGAEWILTIDFDSVFTRKDVIDLIRLMHDHPEADAIAPLQAKRSSNEMLAGIMGDDGKPVDQLPETTDPLSPVHTAHFGLTLLRVSSLLKVRHPWFVGKPDPTGRWGDGRCDDDIVFWLKFQAAGNKTFIANRVAVGHGQMVVTWPAKGGKIIHQYLGEFSEHGKPAEVHQ